VVQPAFHGRLLVAVVLLIAAGAGLALVGMSAAVIHGEPGPAAVFLAVVVGLTAGAVLVARRVRWAVAVCLIGLAGQAAGAVGSGYELVRGVDATKASALRGLGFDPTLGVGINLGYSCIAFGVFCWFAVRWWRLRLRTT
jgi:hypothetical protein